MHAFDHTGTFFATHHRTNECATPHARSGCCRRCLCRVRPSLISSALSKKFASAHVHTAYEHLLSAAGAPVGGLPVVARIPPRTHMRAAPRRFVVDGGDHWLPAVFKSASLCMQALGRTGKTSNHDHLPLVSRRLSNPAMARGELSGWRFNAAVHHHTQTISPDWQKVSVWSCGTDKASARDVTPATQRAWVGACVKG
jgi:hypothetical protein